MKQGRPLLLGDKIDGMVQSNIRKVHEERAEVSTQIVLGAARGILKTIDKQTLRVFGGYIDLSRHWTLSFAPHELCPEKCYNRQKQTC